MCMCINGEFYMCRDVVEKLRQPNIVTSIKSMNDEELKELDKRIVETLSKLFREMA